MSLATTSSGGTGHLLTKPPNYKRLFATHRAPLQEGQSKMISPSCWENSFSGTVNFPVIKTRSVRRAAPGPHTACRFLFAPSLFASPRGS